MDSAQQLSLGFGIAESNRAEQLAKVDLATRNFLKSLNASRTTTHFHVLGLIRWVFNWGTRRGGEPEEVELSIEEIADNLMIGRTTARSVIDLAEASGLLRSRQQFNDRKCYRIGMAAVATWSHNTDAEQQRKAAPVAAHVERDVRPTTPPAAERHGGAVERHGGAAERSTACRSTTPTLINTLLNTSSSIQEPSTAQPPSRLKSEWQKVEEVLFSLGVEAAATCCRFARERGCDPAHVRQLIDHWHTIRTRFRQPPNVLYVRIRDARPSLPVDRGWPNAPTEKARPASDPAKEERTRRRNLASDIIRQGRRAKASESQIESVLARHNLTWDDLKEESELASVTRTQKPRSSVCV